MRTRIFPSRCVLLLSRGVRQHRSSPPRKPVEWLRERGVWFGTAAAGNWPEVTETTGSPEEGIANAIHALSDQTATLVRQELEAAKAELLGKATTWTPALGLVALAGGSGLFAVASSYRLVVRVIDKILPSGVATVVTPALFGSLSLYAGRQATRQISRGEPPPVPTETAKATADAVRSAVNHQPHS